MSERLNCAAVIPVLNPEPGLIRLCERLASRVETVVVVDDGSTSDADRFDALPSGVTLLRHERNRGKGRAMKTAVEWLTANRPEVKAVVFADGDGQHRVEDVVAVAERAIVTDRIVFGCRDFRLGRVPFRSWWGNRWTSLEIKLLMGLSISDTQTGLRAFPRRLWNDLIALPGERFEFEATLFRYLEKKQESLEQLTIKTIYVNSNRASHFRPIKDTLLTQRAILAPFL